MKLTPTTKQFKCILCGELKEKRRDRQRLFHGDQKTDLLLIIEQLLGIHISDEDHSEIVAGIAQINLQPLKNHWLKQKKPTKNAQSSQ